MLGNRQQPPVCCGTRIPWNEEREEGKTTAGTDRVGNTYKKIPNNLLIRVLVAQMQVLNHKFEGAKDVVFLSKEEKARCEGKRIYAASIWS